MKTKFLYALFAAIGIFLFITVVGNAMPPAA